MKTSINIVLTVICLIFFTTNAEAFKISRKSALNTSIQTNAVEVGDDCDSNGSMTDMQPVGQMCYECRDGQQKCCEQWEQLICSNGSWIEYDSGTNREKCTVKTCSGEREIQSAF